MEVDHESEQDPMCTFLRDSKLVMYWMALKTKGYDDFDHFATEMDEEGVRKMGMSVDMAEGHLSRLLSKWRILRFGAGTTETIVATESLGTKMPNRIERLLIPFPETDKLSFFNMVTKSIFEANHALMTLPKLESYIISQRQVQYDIVLNCRAIEEVVKSCSGTETNVDGSYINIRAFLQAKSFSVKEYGKVQMSIKFLKEKQDNASNLVEELKTRKAAIVKNNDILDWKAYELQFLSLRIKEMKEKEDQICSHISYMERLLDKSRVDKVAAKDAEAARVKRSQTKNTDKSNREKKVRHQNSAALVLGIICKKDVSKWMSKVRAGDFGFQILKDEIEFSHFTKLLPGTHLQGLELLLEKEVFLDCHEDVHEEKQTIERKKREEAEKRIEGKRRREEKALNNAKQMRLDKLFKPQK